MRYTRLLPMAAVGLSLGCAETRPADEYPEAVAADPAHYSVEYENDAVRLLRIAYGPGEESVMHYHPATCSIALGAASWQMTDPEGTVTQDSAALGQVDCGDAAVHLPANPGTQPSELILVEFKDGATPGPGTPSENLGAVTADPAHYSVEFENDVVRLLRIAYGPGERSVMHYHPANCWVPLGDSSWRMTDAAGGVNDQPLMIGEVGCADGAAHLPENTGEEPSELILIEFKGREAIAG